MLAKLTGISIDRLFSQGQLASRALQALAIFLVLALCSCTQVSVPKAKTNIRLAPAPFFDNRTGIYFPGAFERLHRQSVIQLEDKTPGLGVALSYRSLDAKLDIFAYDLRAPLIPTGSGSPVVQKSFDDAVANIEKAAARGLYSQLEIRDIGSITLAGQTFLRAQMSYGENLVQKNSELLVSGVNGQILKIRITIASPSTFELERAFSQIEYVILDSQTRGYGSISQSEFSAIDSALKRIDLANGLDENEAKAIAQMELIKRKLHNRFDPTKAILRNRQGSENISVSFEPYVPLSNPNRMNVQFEVLPSGFVRPLNNASL